jgi:isopentenyl diphosphate isomerase/L-lactate dehydrogenase-like FMN-dependent dehydrogenase
MASHRRGSDIVKALCLGARAVMVGRAYAYGLGATGGAGVARAIEILRTDLIRTLKLRGSCISRTAGSILCRYASGLGATTGQLT